MRSDKQNAINKRKKEHKRPFFRFFDKNLALCSLIATEQGVYSPHFREIFTTRKWLSDAMIHYKMGGVTQPRLQIVLVRPASTGQAKSSWV